MSRCIVKLLLEATMVRILISFLITLTSFIALAEAPPEVQEAIVSAEALDKACENHKYRPFREKKYNELSLNEYLNINDICPGYSMGSTLRAVQNMNKLEKQNLANMAKLSADEKAQNIKNRIVFLTSALVDTPLTLAESMMIILHLQNYVKEADKLKNKNLKNIVTEEVKKIQENKAKIYERTIRHDINLILAEYKNGEKGDPKEFEVFKKFVAELIPYNKELQKNLPCLSAQTCKMCGQYFEKKCTVKNRTSGEDLDLDWILNKFSEGTDSFFKKVNRF